VLVSTAVVNVSNVSRIAVTSSLSSLIEDLIPSISPA
jgi:hypothetical protein